MGYFGWIVTSILVYRIIEAGFTPDEEDNDPYYYR